MPYIILYPCNILVDLYLEDFGCLSLIDYWCECGGRANDIWRKSPAAAALRQDNAFRSRVDLIQTQI